MTDIYTQIVWLFILAIPIASIAWTVTQEEVFREPREICVEKHETANTLLVRKFFYLFTCEYCFSHYVALIILLITRYHLLLNDWRGYFIALFALVWIANLYMGIMALVRQGIKKEKTVIKALEKEAEKG